jgi:hypothetical protein
MYRMQEQKLLIEQPANQEHSIETEEPQLLKQQSLKDLHVLILFSTRYNSKKHTYICVHIDF